MSKERIAVFRISLGNATLLSAAYLVVATLIELLRRATGAHWLDSVSKVIESFPVGVLRTFGLLVPMQRAWVQEDLSNTQVRLLYGGTVVVMIFTLGLVVGAGMWVVMKLQHRRAASSD